MPAGVGGWYKETSEERERLTEGLWDPQICGHMKKEDYSRSFIVEIEIRLEDIRGRVSEDLQLAYLFLYSA